MLFPSLLRARVSATAASTAAHPAAYTPASPSWGLPFHFSKALSPLRFFCDTDQEVVRSIGALWHTLYTGRLSLSKENWQGQRALGKREVRFLLEVEVKVGGEEPAQSFCGWKLGPWLPEVTSGRTR